MQRTLRKRKEEVHKDEEYEFHPLKQTPASKNEDPQHGKEKKQWSHLSWKQHCVFTIIILSLMFVFFAYYLPNKINAVSFSIPPLLNLEGPLSINEKLASAEKLFEKKLPGPESIAISVDGTLYTALHNSRIVKIKDNEIHHIASLGKPNCSSVSHCGRGLGVRLDKKEQYLYVADAYKGLVKVELKSGEITKVFPLADEFKVNFFDDFDILPNGDIIISEACSSKYQYHASLQCGMEGSTLGRVIYYSPVSKKHFILAENIAFANGVTQHTDGESVLVVESTRLKVLRIYYTGKQKGMIETFAVLPGIGDNIRPAGNGRSGYWVALFSSCTTHKMCYFDMFRRMPWLRNLLFKMIPIPILHLITVSKHGIVVRLDDNGRIVESLHDTTGHFFTSSEVSQHEDYIYMGSYFLPYLVRYKLDPVN